MRLPHVPGENIKLALIADPKHAEECKSGGVEVDVIDLDFLATFNKDLKTVKNWAKPYHMILATQSQLGKVPGVCGPTLNRIGMFPTPVTHDTPIGDKVEEMRSTVKAQIKKDTCMFLAVGHEKMTDDQLRENFVTALDYLATLTKRGFQSIDSVTIKCTMGPPIKVL